MDSSFTCEDCTEFFESGPHRYKTIGPLCFHCWANRYRLKASAYFGTPDFSGIKKDLER